MKKLLFFLLLIASVTANASTVLWASLAEKDYMSTGYDSIVTDGNSTISVQHFLGGNLADGMYRIILPETQTFLEIYVPEYGWMDGEFGMGVTGDDSGYLYSHTGTFNIEGIDESTLVQMEIGLYVFNADIDDWDVEIMAHSDAVTLASLLDKHTSDSPIPPPTYMDWMPEIFYTDYLLPVPEPSISFLMTIGLCTILLRRKNG